MSFNDTDFPETTPHSPIILQSDAATKNGMSVAGWALLTHNGKFINKLSQCIGKGFPAGTAAELEAVRRALTLIRDDTDIEHLKIQVDCKPVTRHFSNEYWEKYFETLTIEWVPREQNSLADMIASQALDNTINERVKTPDDSVEFTRKKPPENKFGVCD